MCKAYLQAQVGVGAPLLQTRGLEEDWEPYFSQVMMEQQQTVSTWLRDVEATAALVSESLCHLMANRLLDFSLPEQSASLQVRECPSASLPPIT